VLGECSASDLAVTAERVRVQVSRNPVETAAGRIAVTVSIGLVAEHGVGSAVLKGEELLRAADAALYRAKANGRNRVEQATEASQAHAGAAQ